MRVVASYSGQVSPFQRARMSSPVRVAESASRCDAPTVDSDWGTQPRPATAYSRDSSSPCFCTQIVSAATELTFTLTSHGPAERAYVCPHLWLIIMPPKKDSGKGKGKSKADGDGAGAGGGAGKLKAAQSINVRHILVGLRPGSAAVS